MSKKGTKALASATLLSLVLTTALSAGPVKADASNNVTRTYGADRYATAAQVATTNWTSGSKDVVLVCGEGYADAVSGSVLAKTLGAPILLTESSTLSSDAKKALDTLKPTNIYVVGGTASIAQSVRDGLTASGYKLTELGGANRYATNVAVANELVKNHGVSPANVMVVGGEGFSDALSVAPVAAAKGQILLLGCNDQSTMQPVIDFVNTNKSKATVIGTSAVMGDPILKALGVDSSARINGGADRFATNINVLNAFKSDLKNGDIYVANATGDGYADALVASALAGKSASPLVLVDQDGSTATTNALSYIKGEMSSSSKIDVVGGTGVVSDNLFTQLQNLGQNPNPVNDNTVKSVESVGLNQIKVTFDADVDQDSAEDVGNYKVDGITLNNKGTTDGINTASDDNSATATLQDDKRTVLITLSKSKEQQKTYSVSVKNGILTADKNQNIQAKDITVTFSSTNVPTMASVTPKGNSKLTVVFSEPVKVPITKGKNSVNGDIFNPTTDFTSKFKINNQNISSFGLSTTYSEVKDAVPVQGLAGYVWSDKVDFYFSSKLPSGNITFKVSNGDLTNNILSTASGFVVKDQEQNCSIDAVSTAPQVKSASCDPDGTIWVRFDRPMDSVTAIKGGNYGLNGDDQTLAEAGKLKEGDCTVKFKDVSSQKINTGSNTLYVKNSIKDAYGNQVADDTRVPFTKSKDETKPEVKDVSMPDSETIRVQFSKDVSAKYATILSNYKLKDSNGVDISNHIRIVKPANKSVDDTTTYGAITAAGGSFDNDSVWDIKLWKTSKDAYDTDPGDYSNYVNTNDDWKLTGSKYSLTIKNLKDTTSEGNIIDEVTKEVSGIDDVAPKVQPKAYALSAKKVILTFSEAMDASSLDDVSNYQYETGDGTSKALPSDTRTTPGTDGKSVTLEFPDSYHMIDSNSGASYGNENVSGVSSDNKVTGILATGLKDVSGNKVDSFNDTASINMNNGNTFAVKDNTLRVTNDVDEVVVRVQFTNAINMDTLRDPSTNAYRMTFAGMQPDSISNSDSDLLLHFSKGTTTSQSINAAYAATGVSTFGDTKQVVDLPLVAHGANASLGDSTNIDTRNFIKLYGASAKLYVDPNVKDITNATPDASIANAKVFNYTVAPKTTTDYWYAEKATTSAAVVLTFDTEFDASASNVKKDDYTFFVGNKQINASNVKVVGNSVVFKFDGADATTINSATSSDKVAVALKNPTTSSIDLEAIEDGNGDNAKYNPANDDKASETQNLTIYSGDTTVKSWLNGIFGGSDF